MENYGTNRMGGGHKLLQDRLKTEIETLKGISEPCRCGTTRQSYSAAYKEGTAYIKGVMEDCGLTVHEDGVGNVIGTLTGTEPGLAKILSGSHLDTVRCAGAFDGIAGVVCAAEAARLVRESGMPLRHTFQVLGMIGEEGTRFGKALLGSQFIAGIYGEEQLDEFIGIAEILRGYPGKKMRSKHFWKYTVSRGPFWSRRKNRLALWIPSSGCRGLLSK